MTNYLEQIFFEGFATKEGEFEHMGKKFKYKITTVSFEDQQEITDLTSIMSEKAPAMKTGNSYIMEVVSRTLKEFNGLSFENNEKAKEFLSTRPAFLVNVLGRIQGEFEKEIKDILLPEKVDEVFSKTPQTSEESKQD